MEIKNKDSNPSLTNGKTPENLKASLDKEHTSAEPLHTPQVSDDDAPEVTYGNSKIENYLGSEKLDEKLSTQTEKFQYDERQSEINRKKI